MSNLRYRGRAILAAIFLFLLPNAASAHDQRTRWYSIDVMSDGTSPPLFLTVTSSGLAFDRYRSGDPTQQWALTQTDYPTAPRVEGHGPIDGITNCRWGCPFSGKGGDVRKLINRASGACLALRSSGGSFRASVQPCADSERQVWGWLWGRDDLPNGVPPRSEYTALVARNSGQLKCLAADGQAGSRAQAADCGKPLPASEQFRFLEVADLTCGTDFFWQLCFVQGQ